MGGFRIWKRRGYIPHTALRAVDFKTHTLRQMGPILDRLQAELFPEGQSLALPAGDASTSFCKDTSCVFRTCRSDSSFRST